MDPGWDCRPGLPFRGVDGAEDCGLWRLWGNPPVGRLAVIARRRGMGEGMGYLTSFSPAQLTTRDGSSQNFSCGEFTRNQTVSRNEMNDEAGKRPGEVGAPRGVAEAQNGPLSARSRC